jgi:hypothetical protein
VKEGKHLPATVALSQPLRRFPIAAAKATTFVAHILGVCLGALLLLTPVTLFFAENQRISSVGVSRAASTDAWRSTGQRYRIERLVRPKPAA